MRKSDANYQTMLKAKNQAEECLIAESDQALRKSDQLLKLQRMETFRAKGLLSTRGVFETVLKLRSGGVGLAREFQCP